MSTSVLTKPEWVTRPQRERWKFDSEMSKDKDGRYTGPNVNSDGVTEWDHKQQQDEIQRNWENQMDRFHKESSKSCALCGAEATRRRFIGPDTVDDGFEHLWTWKEYGFQCLAHFVEAKGMCLDYCSPCSRRVKDSGDEIVTHYSLGRDAMASDHKVWMAESREEGAYRGDQEWGFMDSWSEATIDRYYKNRAKEAAAVNNRNWERAAGIDFAKVEAKMVATYGYLPQKFGGTPE